jgi:hypothetical protein
MTSVSWGMRLDEVRFSRPSLVIACVDVFSGVAPVTPLSVRLERADPMGQWQPIDQRPAKNEGGIIAYVGLERRANARGLPAATYRFAIDSDDYIASYRQTKDFETVSIAPWDGRAVPAPPLPAPVMVALCPRPDFRFSTGTPVVRGTVSEAIGGAPVPDALIFGFGRLTITDERGGFALPLPGVTLGVPEPIGARDRALRTATLNATFTTNDTPQTLLFTL